MAKRSNSAASIKALSQPRVIHGKTLRADPQVLHAAFPSFAIAPVPAPKTIKSPHGRFTAAEITRAIKAVRKAGQSVSGTEITAEGTIRILHGDVAEYGPSQYDRWKARRDARPT